MLPLRDENRSSTRPYLNYILIAANVAVFLLELVGDYEEIIFTFGAIPYFILRGRRLETLVTSMFVHGDIAHIAGNMLYLFIFGDNIEDRFGHVGYAAIYMMWGILAGLAHVTYTSFAGGEEIIIPAVGASGAISGVLGAYIVFFPNARVLSLVPSYFGVRLTRVPAILFIGLWFLLQLLYSTSLSSVAYWAHIGGFVAGLAFALVRRASKPRRYKI